MGRFLVHSGSLDFYTPVVVAPFHEIVLAFGMENDFVVYCENNTPEILAERLRTLLDCPDYPTLARKAHASVEKFTWNNYVDRLLNLMEANFEPLLSSFLVDETRRKFRTMVRRTIPGDFSLPNNGPAAYIGVTYIVDKADQQGLDEFQRDEYYKKQALD